MAGDLGSRVPWSKIRDLAIKELLKEPHTKAGAILRIDRDGPVLGDGSTTDPFDIPVWHFGEEQKEVPSDLRRLLEKSKPGEKIRYDNADWVVGALVRDLQSADERITFVSLIPAQWVDMEN